MSFCRWVNRTFCMLFLRSIFFSHALFELSLFGWLSESVYFTFGTSQSKMNNKRKRTQYNVYKYIDCIQFCLIFFFFFYSHFCYLFLLLALCVHIVIWQWLSRHSILYQLNVLPHIQVMHRGINIICGHNDE